MRFGTKAEASDRLISRLSPGLRKRIRNHVQTLCAMPHALCIFRVYRRTGNSIRKVVPLGWLSRTRM